MHKYENLFIFDDDFEWDLLKEHENELKHGVTFVEAVETFHDPNALELIDKKHSTVFEKRFYWVGCTQENRILTTWYTERGSRVRIIGSAEFRKYRRLYERTKIK